MRRCDSDCSIRRRWQPSPRHSMGVERPHAMDRGSSRIECSCHRRWTRRRWLMFDSDALSRDVDVPWRRDEGSRIPFADRRVEILHFESYHHIRTWKREGITSSTLYGFHCLHLRIEILHRPFESNVRDVLDSRTQHVSLIGWNGFGCSSRRWIR